MNLKINFTLFFLSFQLLSYAQKGVRIAYIDFNEIIEQIGDYKEATKNLEKG